MNFLKTYLTETSKKVKENKSKEISFCSGERKTKK
jgi:hypothetical protein